MPDERLSRARRIRVRADFERAYEAGQRRRGQLLTVFMVRTTHPVGRLGVAATRKLGSAVVRNRAKRIAREVFRRYATPAGLDVVIVPKREMLDADIRRVEADFLALMAADRRERPARPSNGGGSTSSRRHQGV